MLHGHEVGKAVDVSVSDDGEIDALRIKTGAFLGFGERVLALSKDDFTVLRGAVIVDLPAEAIETLRPCRRTEAETAAPHGAVRLLEEPVIQAGATRSTGRTNLGAG